MLQVSLGTQRTFFSLHPISLFQNSSSNFTFILLPIYIALLFSPSPLVASFSSLTHPPPFLFINHIPPPFSLPTKDVLVCPTSPVGLFFNPPTSCSSPYPLSQGMDLLLANRKRSSFSLSFVLESPTAAHFFDPERCRTCAYACVHAFTTCYYGFTTDTSGLLRAVAKLYVFCALLPLPTAWSPFSSSFFFSTHWTVDVSYRYGFDRSTRSRPTWFKRFFFSSRLNVIDALHCFESKFKSFLLLLSRMILLLARGGFFFSVGTGKIDEQDF